ncbi:hypothetical protein GCM10010345_76440 [Streptomyces canarius]|uniref:Uncharacterized protein n=1 Tax=Streptomyces canarius TaxID=285453 RepID=A0ABQ3D7J6_9ACTN|nr:hypothetical protein GCM10010345_76440 [Streptomyces canarius]
MLSRPEVPTAAYGNSGGWVPLDGVSARAWTPVPGSATAEAYLEAAGYSAPERSAGRLAWAQAVQQ